MKYCVPWTPEEDARLSALRSMGVNSRKMAEILDRSFHAVKSRGIIIARQRSTERSPPHVHIPRSEVPEWYELGWRFAGFAWGDLCKMEWPSSRPARTPQRELAA